MLLFFSFATSMWTSKDSCLQTSVIIPTVTFFFIAFESVWHTQDEEIIHSWMTSSLQHWRERKQQRMHRFCTLSFYSAFFMPLRLWHLCGLCRLKRHPVCVLLCQLSFIVPHTYTQPHINTHKKTKSDFLMFLWKIFEWDTKSNFKRKHTFH